MDLTRQEYNVVLTGDFNTEYKGLYRLLFEKLPLQHISEISFPPDKLAEEALEKPGLEGVILNNVLKKKKSYDHIHIPESWQVEKFTTKEVNSDHKALLLTANY